MTPQSQKPRNEDISRIYLDRARVRKLVYDNAAPNDKTQTWRRENEAVNVSRDTGDLDRAGEKKVHVPQPCTSQQFQRHFRGGA